MRILFTLLIGLLLSPILTQAQYAETIATGRPGNAIGARTVGERLFQVQAGLNFARYSLDNTTDRSLGTDVVMRYGILPNLEISTVLAYDATRTTVDQNGNEIVTENNGISNTQLGFRVAVFKGVKYQPTFAVQYRIRSVLDRDRTDESTLFRSVLILALNQPLTEKSNLTLNGGYFNPGLFHYTINYNVSLSDKISYFVEYFGRVGRGPFSEHNLDTGIGYLVNKDLQLDALIGYGVSRFDGETGPRGVFTSIGVSYRFRHQPLRKK